MPELYAARRDGKGVLPVEAALRAVADLVERDCRGMGGEQVCAALRRLASDIPAGAVIPQKEAAVTTADHT